MARQNMHRLIGALAVLATALAAYAADAPVLVPVLVLDRSDHPVRALERAAFKLFENGMEQQISYFSSDQEPFSIAIILDASASRRDFLEKGSLYEAASPDDEFALVRFGNGAALFTPFAKDKAKLTEAVKSKAKASGPTPLRDAVLASME